jgi:acetyl-CoA carboxylase carboxyltransferase component
VIGIWDSGGARLAGGVAAMDRIGQMSVRSSGTRWTAPVPGYSMNSGITRGGQMPMLKSPAE